MPCVRKASLRIGLAILAAFVSISPAQPVTPAFTIQGELGQSGSPAPGPVDLRFRLYDSLAGPGQIGSQLGATNVALVAGRFTVPAQVEGEARQRALREPAHRVRVAPAMLGHAVHDEHPTARVRGNEFLADEIRPLKPGHPPQYAANKAEDGSRHRSPALSGGASVPGFVVEGVFAEQAFR